MSTSPPDKSADARRRSGSTVVLNELILRSIVDYAIVTLDVNGIITSWNEGAERTLGWSEEEAVGQHGSIFFTKEDTVQSRPEIEMANALEHGRAEDERWHVRKNGQKFWASGLMMPLLNASDTEGNAVQGEGAIEGFVKIFRDRTHDGEGNAAFSEMETRAALALRKSGALGIFDYDLLGDTVVADPVAAVLHGVTVADARHGTSAEDFFDGIVPEDVDEVREALAASVARDEDLTISYRVVSPNPQPRWVHSQSSVQRDGDGRIARLAGIVTEVTQAREETRMQRARLGFSDDVRGLTDPDAVTRLASSVVGKTLYAIRAGYGYVSDDGDTIDVRADWTAPDTVSLVGPVRLSDFGSYGAALRRGESVVIADVHEDDRVEDTTALETIGVRSLVNLPLMDGNRLKAVMFVDDMRPRKWSDSEIAFLQSIFDRADASIERVRSETERDMMSAELAHRMKNMLSIAQVIVSQSLRRVEGLDAERNAIAGRLNALGDAQDVLTEVNNQEAGIRTVMEAVLQPHNTLDHMTMHGPDLTLPSQQVLGLSLALHELATNAAKYGALSNEDGRVDITWSKGEDGAFELRWSENAGPPVTPPAQRGFGSTILDRITGQYFGGTSRVDFQPTGIVFTLTGRV